MDIPKSVLSKSFEVDGSPVSAYSRSSTSGAHSAMSSSFNAYSVSPRSTSMMFQYYSTPKGYYKSPRPLSGISNFERSNAVNHAHMQKYERQLVRTTSESNGGLDGKITVASGIPHTIQRDVVEDPRRRAWSESDKKGVSSMNSSRMSALRKLRKRLSRTGSQKKSTKDEPPDSRYSSQSRLSDTSISNVEEGKPLFVQSPTEVKRNAFPFSPEAETRSRFSTLSLHEEDETEKTSINDPGSEPKSPVSSLIYQRFLEEHTCYDIMPTSCKLIVFDTRLQASKAFHALLSNSVRSAPLWDSVGCRYVGMLTVTDFINMIIKCHRSPDLKMDFLENETLQAWRETLGKHSHFAHIQPHHSLLHSLQTLTNEHYHGIPILDSSTGDIFHVINHKRILRFIHLFINELPIPDFMHKTLQETGIGTYRNVCTINKSQSLLEVLEMISQHKLTAVPVLDDNGEVVDVFCKLDIIPLAAQSLYRELDTTLDVALQSRFTPLFEDEVPVTQDRYPSPKPTMRQTLSPGSTPPNNHFNIHRSAEKVTTGSPHRPQTLPVAPETVRHSRSVNNPLVKCKLSENIKTIIDLLVSSEANLLVVVGEGNNHVVGVVTASDVLCYITNPQPPKECRTSAPVPNSSSDSISISMTHDSGYTSSSSTVKYNEEDNPVTSFFAEGLNSEVQRADFNSLRTGAKIQRA